MRIKAVVYVERRSVSPERRPNVTPHDEILQVFDDAYLAKVCTSLRIPRHALAMTSLRQDDITVICHDEVEAKAISQALNRLLPPASSAWMSAYDIMKNAYVGFERLTEERDLAYEIHVDPAAVSGVKIFDQRYLTQACTTLRIRRQTLDVLPREGEFTLGRFLIVACPNKVTAQRVSDALNALLPPPSAQWTQDGNDHTAVLKSYDTSLSQEMGTEDGAPGAMPPMEDSYRDQRPLYESIPQHIDTEIAAHLFLRVARETSNPRIIKGISDAISTVKRHGGRGDASGAIHTLARLSGISQESRIRLSFAAMIFCKAWRDAQRGGNHRVGPVGAPRMTSESLHAFFLRGVGDCASPRSSEGARRQDRSRISDREHSAQSPRNRPPREVE